MKRDPKNSRRPNDGAANLAMLKRTVKKLFSYYPVLAPVTFACILFSAIVTSIPSLFVQNVIQVIEKWYVSRDWVSAKAELIPILSLLISLYVLSIIAILVYKQLMAYMTQGFLDKLRQEMFGGMQDLPIRYFDTHQHGDIMSFYTNDIDTLRQLVSEAIPAFIQSGAIVLAVFGIMLYFSIWLTLISVLGVILMIVVTKRVGGGSAKFFLRQQQAVAKTEGYIQETMTGQKVVKVFCHEQKSIEDFVRWSERYDLWCKLKLFGQMIYEADNEQAKTDKEFVSGPKNLLRMLPDEFTLEDYLKLRRQQGFEGDDRKRAMNAINQWVHRGYVARLTMVPPSMGVAAEQVDDNDNYSSIFRKLKFLNS